LSAQDTPAENRSEFPTWKYKIGVEDRLRYEYRHEFNFSQNVKDSGSGYGTGSQIFNRFRISGQALLSDEYLNDIFEVFVEALDGTVGSYQMKPLNSQKDTFDLHQAYFNLKDILGSPFDFKIGREEFKYGAGRLIWAPTWANRIRSFDGAVLKFHPGNLYCDLLLGSDVKYDNHNFNHINFREKLTGIYAGYQKDKVSPLVEAYFLSQIIHTDATRSTRNTAGARLVGRIPGNILYDIEFPYQFGKASHKTIKAYAFHIDLSHAFLSALWQPNVSFEYNQASGDKDPNDKKSGTFIPLYQSTHEPYGLMDFFRWQNMREVAFSVNLFLTEKLKLTPQTNCFWLMSTNDSWYDSTGTALRNVKKGLRSYHVGQEVSLRANYDFTKNLKWETGYAHFFTGKYVAISGANDDADWVYTQLYFKY
jgi:hypothetical protein